MPFLLNRVMKAPPISFPFISPPSSNFLARLSGLLPIRTDPELRILEAVGKAPRPGDQRSPKSATYAGEHEHRRNADKHPCLERDSNHDTSVRVGKEISCLRPRATVISPFDFITTMVMGTPTGTCTKIGVSRIFRQVCPATLRSTRQM